MPLNEKGNKILGNMKNTYGRKEGERVFYASENSGKIKNVTKSKPKKKGY